MPRLLLVLALLVLTPSLFAQADRGVIHGTIAGATENSATVTLQTSGAPPRTTITDTSGKFSFAQIPFNTYQLVYGPTGAAERRTIPVTVDAQNAAIDLGSLTLGGEAPLQMEALQVGARQEAFYNSIDRKVYNVGKDITSTTGSASDLLQNVPSVQVDVEGAVSLRGDSGVQILINGKPSAMISRNPAAALEQMSADSIERVEVITNPSAKYKPDGTGGIINLVLKRERSLGHFGSLRASVGNDRRYNAGLSASYNPGTYTLYGSVSTRQDDRGRFGREERMRLDGAGTVLSSTLQDSTEDSRPLSRVAQMGADFEFGRDTKLGLSLGYDDRKSSPRGTRIDVTRDAAGAIARSYERIRTGPQVEREIEAELSFEHTFAGDRELSAELSFERGKENEQDFYSTVSQLAGLAPSFDAQAQKSIQSETSASFDYVHPLSGDAKLELGYEFEHEKSDDDFRATTLDAASNRWIVDPQTTNRFVHDSAINAFYATFGRPIGKFGFLAGLRYEHARIKTNQVTAALRNTNAYGRVYPSLHLSYRFTDEHQLQLSYSHRVNRPDGGDLNPFPEYDDPFDRSAGNPNLVPEDTHSIEGGYQYEANDTTYLASLYVRQRENGITNVTRYIDAHTLLTTPENLSTSRSAGLELGATRRIGENLALNLSANVYRSEIDAANLGFSSRRTATAWDAKLNVNWDVTDRLVTQFTTGYTARRLTAQGERHPSAVTNLGLRYNLKDKRTAFVLTVSDLFKTMKDRTTIDTPILKGETTRRRSSQIIYLGVIYNFGRPAKRDQESLEFDNTL